MYVTFSSYYNLALHLRNDLLKISVYLPISGSLETVESYELYILYFLIVFFFNTSKPGIN